MTGAALGLGYSVLAALACLVAWRQTEGRVDDFMKVAAVYLAVLTSILTALISYLNVSRQASLLAEVERLKTTLAADIEGMKTRLSAASQAYDALLAAMTGYHHALAPAETGAYDESKVAQAEAGMQSAAHQMYRLAAPCRKAFEDFWQRARSLSELLADAPSAVARTERWGQHTRQVAGLFEDFAASVKHHHNLS